jgi:uncharacterized protein YgbK (DUF1537 family)
MSSFGAVADDITGACDLADAVCAEGASTAVVFGPPTGPMPRADWVIVALKSRTAPVPQAVAESVAAARWLLDGGCRWLYQKYCSTFDSTDDGNIGPVADALRTLLGASTTSVGTPATPRVGRTVYQGQLFLGRRLLADSPMRDHPLTPMRDSDLVAVLGRQTPAAVGLVARATVAAGPDAVAHAIHSVAADSGGHVLVDALDDHDLDVAAAGVVRLTDPVLLGGAAGFAAALARAHSRGVAAPHATAAAPSAPPSARAPASARAMPAVSPGRRLILAGSCSARTREQVAAFPGPRVDVSPSELATDPGGPIAAALAAVRAAAPDRPVLVTSSAPPDEVAVVARRLGPGRAAALVEQTMGAIARRAVDTLDVRRLLVAGGETSGAVVAALGLRSARVGPAVAPGLSWMVPDDNAELAVLFKSGNFGEPDLFDSAWASCP